MTFPVLSSLEDGILTLQLNNPEVRNAMSQPMGEVLKRELRDAAQDPGVRVVILTGVGDASCAGADVSMPGMIEAYDSPLEVVKTRLDHLEVVYVMKPCTVPNFRFLPRQNIRDVRRNSFQEGLDKKIEGGAYPPVVHPLGFHSARNGTQGAQPLAAVRRLDAWDESRRRRRSAEVAGEPHYRRSPRIRSRLAGGWHGPLGQLAYAPLRARCARRRGTCPRSEIVKL